VLGLMASTISDSLLTHVNYEWMDPVVCPSISKALWDILKGLFGTVGIASTITQTVEPVNFNMSTVSKRILMDMDLRATRKPLHARISQAESGGQASSSSSVNRTNVIKRGPPPQNQWRSQTPSYQPKTFGNQPSGSYSNQPQLGSVNPNQRKNSGPAKSK